MVIGLAVNPSPIPIYRPGRAADTSRAGFRSTYSMKISSEIKVALLVITALVMLYFGFNFLKGTNVFSSSRPYETVFSNVDGLTASSPVQINGLGVGRVKSIEILQNEGNKLLVTIELGKDILVGAGSTVGLADAGLLGGKLLHLTVRNSNRPLPPGSRLPSLIESGLAATLGRKAEPVLNSLDSLTKQLTLVVKQFDKTGLILNQTLRGASQTVGTLDATIGENRAGLRAVLANVNLLTQSLAKTERQLGPLLTKAGSFADSLNALQLSRTLAGVNKSVAMLQATIVDLNRGKGTVGKLLKDEAVYANINNSVVSLNKLLTDLRQNPKRYVSISVFGRKQTPAKDVQLDPPAVLPADSTR
jgi:phospholipid/cholesterol/gamma-HCH transport system substrate-binding protein